MAYTVINLSTDEMQFLIEVIECAGQFVWNERDRKIGDKLIDDIRYALERTIQISNENNGVK